MSIFSWGITPSFFYTKLFIVPQELPALKFSYDSDNHFVSVTDPKLIILMKF